MASIKEHKPKSRAFARGILPDLVGYHLRRAQVAVFADFARRIGAYDVTPGQFGVLSLIEANSGLNQSELGLAMGVDRSTVVAVIDRLEGRRLVARRRAPGDRRSYALELTSEGRALLQTLVPLVRQHEADLCRGLSANEQAQALTLLQKICRNLE